MPSDDLVLIAWRQLVAGFDRFVPVLVQLSSKSLRIDHWHQIFRYFGAIFDPDRPYLVHDLIALVGSDPGRWELIGGLVTTATNQVDSESRFGQLCRDWSERKFAVEQLADVRPAVFRITGVRHLKDLIEVLF